MSSTIYVFSQEGACLQKRSGTLTPELMRAYQLKFGPEVVVTEWPEDPYPAIHDVASFTAEFEGSQVVDIAVASGPEEKYLHVAIAAPGSGPTGVPSVASGETAVVTADIRDGEESSGALMAFNGSIRVPYRKNGSYHGELRMEFAAGQCVYTFAPQSHHHGTLTIDETDFGLLNGYRIRVVGSPKLIVDELSAA